MKLVNKFTESGCLDRAPSLYVNNRQESVYIESLKPRYYSISKPIARISYDGCCHYSSLAVLLFAAMLVRRIWYFLASSVQLTW
jgi:hypothetical protein